MKDINDVLFKPSQGPHASESLAEICYQVRTELERVDLIKYVKCILTAYVVKSPPDHEAGLTLLLRLRGRIHQLSIFFFKLLYY